MSPSNRFFLTGPILLFSIFLSLWPAPGSISFAAARPRSAKRPNILLAIADDWSYGHAGAYGCSWVKTPAFDRLAKEGILFTRAFTPNAKCAPSRAIILTGRHSWQLKEAANHWCFFPPEFGGFVERLAADGYFAGCTGKGWAPGIANDVNGNPRAMTGKAYREHKCTPPAKRMSSEDYAANFKTFLEDAPTGQPWFFWYGAREPHRGYEYQSGVRFGKKLSDIDRVPGCWPDNEITRHDMLDYAVEVEYFDAHLGEILRLLEEAGQLENTLVVATSDHGMPFPRVKGQAYNDSNHVPLAVRWPKGIINPGRTVNELVDFTDLAPTFLEAAGISDPAPIMQPITGRSLLNMFTGSNETAIRDHVLIGKERHDVGRPGDAGYPIRGIRQGNWLYIRNFEINRWPAGNPETGYLNSDGGPVKSAILDLRRHAGDTNFWNLCFGKRPAEELYNLQDDPDCLKNLAASPEHQEIATKLRARMEAELKAQGDPRMFGKGDVFDSYPSANQKTRNFYSRYTNGESLRASWVNLSDFETEPIHKKPLARTPPMGWNSFMSYGVYLHEEAALANVDAMAEKLKPYGYEYFVIDNGWFGEYQLVLGTIFAAEKHASDVNIDEFGLFEPSKVYFPGGLKPVIDRCHEKGLKFGLHLMRGIPRKAVELDLPIKGTPYRASQIADTKPENNCTWCTYNYGIEMSKPGAQEFYNSLIRKMADMGVDFIKYDDIVPYPREVEAVAKAIENCGRPIVLSLSPGDHVDPKHVDSFRTANMLRVTPDIWDRQKGINTCFEAWRKWRGYEQPGFWIDMDMIPFGRLQLMSPPGQSGDVMKKGDIALAGRGTRRTSQLTKDQMRTFITLRALAASPLMVGGDLPTLDEFSLALLTNPQMLACNQNGVMGDLVFKEGPVEIWKTGQKDNANAGWFGVFNRSGEEITVKLPTEPLNIPASAKLQDIWNSQTLLFGAPCHIPANGVLFVRYE